MALNLLNLDAKTRQKMIAEFDSDVQNIKLYQSPRLSTIGIKEYENLFREAINNHDDSWLAEQLRLNNRMNTVETRNTKNGAIAVKVPVNAPDMLAEGEFNRFYARGLCVRAIEEQITKLEVYRAKQATNPRPESQNKIGSSVDPKILLSDLRNNIGVEPALGIPPGPNSGLSVKLP